MCAATFLDRFYDHAQARGDAVYLRQPTVDGAVDEISWARALDEARRIASYLRSLELAPGSAIGAISKNCAHLFLSDLATWMAGHVSVLLYPSSDPETTRYVLEHSECKVLFVGAVERWPAVKSVVPEGVACVAYPGSSASELTAWGELLASHAPIEGHPARAGSDLATIIYTSGSTGQPKGVMHSFATITCATRGIAERTSSGPSDRLLSYLPLAAALERYVVEAHSMWSGCQVYFLESLATFRRDLKRTRPTLFMSVPRLWTKFQERVHAVIPAPLLRRVLGLPIVGRAAGKGVLELLGLRHVRFAGTGSALIPEDVFDWYRSLGLELLEGYGLTENLAYSHISQHGKIRVGYVGNTFPGVEHRIAADGEVQVKSPATMLGYFKEPELTRAALTDDGFLRTGDCGEIDEEGRLRITGRLKDLFKTSKGKYIAPAPLENRLNNHPFVDLSCVMGAGFPMPCAIVMLSEAAGDRADPARRTEIAEALGRLLEELRETSEAHERLEFLAVVADPWTILNGMLTPTLKIRRAVIEAAYAPRLAPWYDARQPLLWA